MNDKSKKPKKKSLKTIRKEKVGKSLERNVFKKKPKPKPQPKKRRN